MNNKLIKSWFSQLERHLTKQWASGIRGGGPFISNRQFFTQQKPERLVTHIRIVRVNTSITYVILTVGHSVYTPTYASSTPLYIVMRSLGNNPASVEALEVTIGDDPLVKLDELDSLKKIVGRVSDIVNG